MDKLNGILTNINAALDKFQVGSGPLAGKSIASATQGLNFMEVGGREGGREGGGAWNYRVPRRMGDGGYRQSHADSVCEYEHMHTTHACTVRRGVYATLCLARLPSGPGMHHRSRGPLHRRDPVHNFSGQGQKSGLTSGGSLTVSPPVSAYLCTTHGCPPFRASRPSFPPSPCLHLCSQSSLQSLQAKSTCPLPTLPLPPSVVLPPEPQGQDHGHAQQHQPRAADRRRQRGRCCIGGGCVPAVLQLTGHRRPQQQGAHYACMGGLPV